MKKFVGAGLTLVCLAFVSVGCDMQRLSNALAPTGLDVSGASTAVNGLVGKWASLTGTDVASLKTCSNFQWNVTSQTATSINGQFSVVCLGTYNVTGKRC